MLVPPPERGSAVASARAAPGPRPSGLASLALGSLALGIMVLGGIALRWQLSRLETASAVLARLVDGEPSQEDLEDEETVGLAVE
mmetsp:Transcript_11046/g.25151  ORF Transcript_11046/g.25151 Transcript_11046/m.25151 type:complete len:85 (+) Transcript_11046:2-256(+)